MMECNKHIFEGRADGVHCKRCGLHLSVEQYAAYLHPPDRETPTQGPAEAAEKAPAKRGRRKVNP